MTGIEIRRFTQHDSPEELTELLHRAYADHAAEGRRFFASYQSVDDTRHRISKGETWIAVADNSIVGTVTVRGSYDRPEGYPVSSLAGTFYQLAITPERRGTGLGDRLLRLAEQRIAALGATEIGIDTSELATDLIGWYERRGYERCGFWDWAVTNYRSVVLRKVLSDIDSGTQ